jgi:hypothetical protein
MLHGVLAWKYALLWLSAFLIVALFEEGLLRGYLQFTLTRGLTFWWAAAMLSVLFGLLHVGNEGESPIGIFVAIAGGLVLCLSLKLTGSLLWHKDISMRHTRLETHSGVAGPQGRKAASMPCSRFSRWWPESGWRGGDGPRFLFQVTDDAKPWG